MSRISGSTAVANTTTTSPLLLLVIALLFDISSGFQTANPKLAFSIRQQAPIKQSSCFIRPSSLTQLLLAQSSQPEFSVTGDGEEGDDDNNDDDDDFYSDYNASVAAETSESNNAAKFRQHRNDYGDLIIVNEDPNMPTQQRKEFSSSSSSQSNKEPRTPTEYGYLRPGTVVQIEVGDLSLARKAWKKRRRSGSPLLVPCSILNVDRQSMVRWNLLFLLEKFGRPVKNKGGAASSIEISLSSLAKHYRTFLKSSMQRQVDALDFETSQDMMQSLFNKKVQESYGVILDERTDDNNILRRGQQEQASMLYLTAPMTRRKAQARTANAPMMQFRLPREGDQGDVDTLTHTGYVRSKSEAAAAPSSSDDNGDVNNKEEGNDYTYLPLSAALRVSQKEDLDSGRVQEGTILSAAILDYDLIGDGGSPLLTLTVDPGTVRDKLKYKADRVAMLQKPKTMINDLKMGDGPFTAKVVQMRNCVALVDFGVGRHVAGMEGSEKVLATLRFKDALEYAEDSSTRKKMDRWVEYDDDDDDDDDTEQLIAATIEDLDMLDDEDDDDEDDWNDDEDDEDDSVEALLELRKDAYEEDGEVEDDISHLFEVDADGNLMYKDPNTGELSELEEDFEVIGGMDEDDDDDEEAVEDDSVAVDDDEDSLPDEDDETLDDDISDKEILNLFIQNEDGSMSFRDPETGETLDVREGEGEYQDMLTMKALIDEFLPKKGATSQPTKDDHSVTAPTLKSSEKKPKLQRKILDLGDYVKVYVLDNSKQSRFLRVTTNPLVKGLKPKDIKKQEGANKKLQRLRLQIGGNLNNALILKGRTVNGVVKSTSKTGDWVYVQPLWKRDFPVGIGLLTTEALQNVSAGDYVECLFDGIDYDRGQLAFRVIKQLDEDAAAQAEKIEKQPWEIKVQPATRHQLGKSKSGKRVPRKQRAPSRHPN